MPADPQPPLPPAVEAMLRDAARRRREEFDAAGPNAATTMPGPMRARLHAELAKRFDTPPATAPSGRGLARWWPAWAGAVGAAAAVALFVVAGQRPSHPPAVVVGSAPSGPPAVAREEAAPPPAPVAAAPVPPEVPKAADTAGTPGAATGPLLAKDKAEAATGAQTTAAEPVLRTQTFTQTPFPIATADIPVARRGPAPAAKSSARAAAAAPPAAAKPAPAAPVSPTPPPPLLGNFRFEQRGENVRVVDADGSVYVGQVEPEAKPTDARSRQAEAAGAANVQTRSGEISPQATENFRFRASGDNRTLRKPVVFEGQYSANAAPAQTNATANHNQPGAEQTLKQAAAPQPSPTPEAQIRGRVRVLDNNLEAPRDAEVDARSVETGTPR